MSKLDDINLEDLEELLEDEDTGSTIDWASMLRKLYAKRKLFIISFFLTVLIVYPLARSVPRFYQVQVKLAPEFTSATNSSTSGLSSLMRSFGIGRSSSNSADDAILPNLYPDLMNSKSFLVSLFDIPVQTKDGEVKCTYYEYLAKHQKKSAVSMAIGGIMSLLPKGQKEGQKEVLQEDKRVNAGALTKEQDRVTMAISAKVVCDVNDKTGVITIDVTDQDPVICAEIADSACSRLQEFITEYRTKKSRLEMENAQKQYNQAEMDYLAAKHKAEAFNDANWDLVDEDLIVEKQAINNDMQMAFNNMTSFNQQLLTARAKYESLRPVYTVLDGASIPLKPAGPGRLSKVLMVLFLILGCEAAWILFFADFKKKIKEALKEPEEEQPSETKED